MSVLRKGRSGLSGRDGLHPRNAQWVLLRTVILAAPTVCSEQQAATDPGKWWQHPSCLNKMGGFSLRTWGIAVLSGGGEARRKDCICTGSGQFAWEAWNEKYWPSSKGKGVVNCIPRNFTHYDSKNLLLTFMSERMKNEGKGSWIQESVQNPRGVSVTFSWVNVDEMKLSNMGVQVHLRRNSRGGLYRTEGACTAGQGLERRTLKKLRKERF